MVISQPQIDANPEGCAICLDNFKPGDTVRLLPCLHIFHAGTDIGGASLCVDGWFDAGKTECPECRAPIVAFEDKLPPKKRRRIPHNQRDVNESQASGSRFPETVEAGRQGGGLQHDIQEYGTNRRHSQLFIHRDSRDWNTPGSSGDRRSRGRRSDSRARDSRSPSSGSHVSETVEAGRRGGRHRRHSHRQAANRDRRRRHRDSRGRDSCICGQCRPRGRRSDSRAIESRSPSSGSHVSETVEAGRRGGRHQDDVRRDDHRSRHRRHSHGQSRAAMYLDLEDSRGGDTPRSSGDSRSRGRHSETSRARDASMVLDLEDDFDRDGRDTPRVDRSRARRRSETNRARDRRRSRASSVILTVRDDRSRSRYRRRDSRY